MYYKTFYIFFGYCVLESILMIGLDLAIFFYAFRIIIADPVFHLLASSNNLIQKLLLFVTRKTNKVNS